MPRMHFSIERVSVTSDGADANGVSYQPAISANARFVAYTSNSTNIVPGDNNGEGDILLLDRETGTTERVSISSDGTEANDRSFSPDLSGNGRYTTFYSDATNLVPSDTNGVRDIFVHDRKTGITERLSINGSGIEGNDNSLDPVIADDGRYVAYESSATNLVSGDTNGVRDVFLLDWKTGITQRVSVAGDGTEANDTSFSTSISRDGRYVGYLSEATNLVPGDTNGVGDVFVFDRKTGMTERISVASDGTEANNFSARPAFSKNGRYVAYESEASNLVPSDTNNAKDIFLLDRKKGTVERISVASDGTEANYESTVADISADGRYITYTSWASNLVSGDTNGIEDVFVFDRKKGMTERISVARDGTEGNEVSILPAMSAKGDYVAFYSVATNLVPDDANNMEDIFLAARYDCFI